MFVAAWHVMLELAPWLLLGAAIAGVLHVLLPIDFVQRHLRGRLGVLKAVALGIPLPLCSCGVIPAGIGLKKDGASDGAAVGFLVSTPQTGVDSILVSASMLGWPFALFKVAAAGVMGIVAGVLTDSGRSRPVAVPSPKPNGRRRPPRAALTHSLDVLRTIWRWLVFGIVASALITAFVPADWLASLRGDHELIALLAALLISVPLYVCATASVPIAAALVVAGFPPGAALVLLIAGPATNVATIGAVHRGLGRRALVVYLGVVVIGSLALGWAFDFVIPIGTTAVHEHAEASWWAIGSAVLLSGLIGWFAFDDLRSWLRPAPSVPPADCGRCAAQGESA